MRLFLLLLSTISCSVLTAQVISSYIKNNAVRVEDTAFLSDSACQLLRPFQIVMLGEMHGTNEASQFVTALAKRLSNLGDSVQVGLEIPSGQMADFLQNRTPGSIYTSAFFATPSFESGRESYAWAGVIDSLLHTPGVELFFFDVNRDEDAQNDRDSMMYVKLKERYSAHPGWKMITLSGNVHAMTSPQVQLGRNTMASFLKQDTALNLSTKICSLNNYYWKGACRANFGNGLEEKQLERPENVFDTALGFERYLLLLSADSTYPFNGIYYTKYITPARMVRR